MGLLVASVWIIGESEGAQVFGNWAIRHPRFESMEHGGSGQNLVALEKLGNVVVESELDSFCLLAEWQRRSFQKCISGFSS